MKGKPDNQHDQYVVRLVKNGETVGHIPRNVSPACLFALIAGELMYAVVIGERENKRGRGLEAPVRHQVKGPRQHILKAQTIVMKKL